MKTAPLGKERPCPGRELACASPVAAKAIRASARVWIAETERSAVTAFRWNYRGILRPQVPSVPTPPRLTNWQSAAAPCYNNPSRTRTRIMRLQNQRTFLLIGCCLGTGGTSISLLLIPFSWMAAVSALAFFTFFCLSLWKAFLLERPTHEKPGDEDKPVF